MKRSRASRLFLLIAGLAAPGCARELPRPSPENISAPAPRDAAETIAFDRQTLVFNPSRDDFTVASAVFGIHCSRPEEVRVNGARPDSSWLYLDLVEVGKNRFELAPLEIVIPGKPSGLLCMSVKVWFHQVPNEYDSLYYQETDDRYALVSFATRTEGPDWKAARARFGQNRVETLVEFRDALSRPFEIRLNQRPLADLERLRTKAAGRP